MINIFTNSKKNPQPEFQKDTDDVYLFYNTAHEDIPQNPLSQKGLQVLKTLLKDLENIPCPRQGAQGLGYRNAKHRQQIQSRYAKHVNLDEHEYLQRVCYGCGLMHAITCRCRNKACTTCRYSLYKNLYDRLVCSIQQGTKPPRLIHQVFTIKSPSLMDVSPKDIRSLRESLKKLREQRWFKTKIAGGFFYIEMNFNLEELTCNPHLHVLSETFLPTNTKPINIAEANAAWHKLTKGNAHSPHALQKYNDALRLCDYILKQEWRGESTLNTLTKSIENLKNETEFMLENAQKEVEDIKYIVTETLHCLREEISLTEELRHVLTRIYNVTFADQRRYGFFGSWHGHGKDFAKTNKSQPWACATCGSTESGIIYN